MNLAEAKSRLSHYLDVAATGESVVICRHNVPVAEIRSLPLPASRRRPIGLAKGTFQVARRFFDPLPDDLLAAFTGDANPA